MNQEYTEPENAANLKKPVWVKPLAILYILSLIPLTPLLLGYFVILMFHMNVLALLVMMGIVLFPILLIYTIIIAYISSNNINFSTRERKFMIVPAVFILFFLLAYYVPYYVSSKVKKQENIAADTALEQNMAKVNIDIVGVIEKMKQNSPEILSYSCGKTGGLRLFDKCADLIIKIDNFTEPDIRKYLLTKITYLEEIKAIISSSFLGERTNLTLSFGSVNTKGGSGTVETVNCSEKIYPNRDDVIISVPLRGNEDGLKCIVYAKN